jgi:predicted dehydrogenase
VAAFAQRRSLTGFGETPDVLNAIFEYPAFIATWASREIAAGGKAGLEIYGTKGMLAINRRGFEIVPDKALTPESQIPKFTEPTVDPAAVAFRTDAVKDDGYDQIRDQFQPHVRNFLDAIKSRQAPVSDLASAHQTSLACHLANIAARVGRVVNWDATANGIGGDADANALLTKAYRAPWDRELAAVVKSARG